jgi:DNA mismatch repair protein MutS
MNKTPMMQQYDEAKAACGDALLFFRMGDFYELFHEDARTAAKVLGLTLTSRDKGENPVPMAGFPHHQLQSYLGKLIKAGYRAAVCEQVEDPKLAKGLVKREVTRVVTPGTITDDELLDPLECNYLAAVSPSSNVRGQPQPIGLAWAELSTGRFFAMTLPPQQLADHLARIRPAETLVSEDDPGSTVLSRMASVRRRPNWSFALNNAQRSLNSQFGTLNLAGFGFDEEQDSPAIRAAGAVLEYLRETQKSSLAHIDQIGRYQSGNALEIDHATRLSLELTRTIRGGDRSGSLLAVINRAATPMGARLLSDWLAAPLTDKTQIERRLDAVGELAFESTLRGRLRAALREMFDVERLVSKVTSGRANPRDISCIGKTLAALPKIKAAIAGRRSELLGELEQELDLLPEVRSEIERALEENCPLTQKEGGIIRVGFSARLDELRELAAGGKQWIANYQQRIMQETGISTLKVGFNKVFGYYIEATNAQRDKLPENFIRKQTLKNAERYITPELKEYEDKVLSADEQSLGLEEELFIQVRTLVQQHARRLQKTAQALAKIDVLCGLAELAAQRNYCRPAIYVEPVLEIEDGRHPVLDLIESEGKFVGNDTMLGGDSGTFMLITGPNMAGKSTYIRQVALITLMAQIGSFVPAKTAKIGIADRIFARVGASDELSKGQSTFMVEMTETARILNTASQNSLVILDEIGRGTSTYDGVSLAWAIVEYIHDQIGCRALFATHYHELTDLQSSLSGVRNFNVSVKEWNDDLVFLHRIVPGATDKSYGIHVARLAGVPKSVNERAKQILAQLESEHLDENGKAKMSRQVKHRPQRDLQLTLFGFQEHPLLDKIRELELDELTPVAALRLLDDWQQSLKTSD